MISTSASATLYGMALTALTPVQRKTVVVLHAITSLGWLGLTIGNFVLVLTALNTGDPATQHAALLAMEIVGATLLIPISLSALATGLLLSLGTRWGLFRYRWVLVKFALTVIAVVLTPLSLLPGLHKTGDAVRAAAATELIDTGQFASGTLVAACVSSSMYITCTILSAFKPWGRTRTRRTHGNGAQAVTT